MHVSDSSCTWFLYNLNTSRCSSQIMCKRQYVHMYIHNSDVFFLSTHPLPPSLLHSAPSLHDPTLLFTYLEIPLLLFVVRIPIHSCPWLAIKCSPLATSPTQGHPTDQVTYLHRRHQQHQPSCLIHLLCYGS
jgi:hypothetical protein